MSCTPPVIDTTSVNVTSSLNAVAMAADGGWAGGESQALLKLSNGAWSKQSAPSGNFTYTIYDAKLIDAQNGWAVGGWVASAGGSTYYYGFGLKLAGGVWTLTQNSLAFELRGVDLVDANNGWAVGRSGQLVKIQGGTYSPQFGGAVTSTLYDVALTDANTGWAVGASGAIRKLQAGTWTTVTSPTSETLTGITLTDAQNGWAVGAHGTTLKLSSGTWTVVPAVTNKNLNGVTQAGGGLFWAVGADGTVLKNTGSLWQQCSTGTGSDPALLSVSSANGETWAVGSNAHRRKLLP